MTGDGDGREFRDLLIEIRTKLDVMVSRDEDKEIRLRKLEQSAVTNEDLKATRNNTIGVLSVVLLVIGGIVGLVAALV